MDSNLRAENRMLKEQLEIIVNDNQNAKYTIQELIKANETLNQENKQLKEKIESVDEFCDRYMGCNLELFDMYGLLIKIREILGDKE